jgi:AcrR family transcriptional regulator
MVTHLKGVDPRVKRTNQLLQQALLELLQEKSFTFISVQDISERATVNRATFYTHFEDKYHLLDSIIREQFQREVASKLPPVPRWGVNTLRVLIQVVFDYLREAQSQWKHTDTQFDDLFKQIIQEELREFLSSWLKQVPALGTGRRVPVGTMALVMSWAIFGAAVQWSRGARTTTAEQVVNQVLIVLTEGVAHLTPGLLEETRR